MAYYRKRVATSTIRGEPDIPVADEGALQTPGAMVGPGGGGTTSVPYENA